eukprot:scaffold71842_cov33-Tisochrysis_lutea.AAC.4
MRGSIPPTSWPPRGRGEETRRCPSAPAPTHSQPTTPSSGKETLMVFSVHTKDRCFTSNLVLRCPPKAPTPRQLWEGEKSPRELLVGPKLPGELPRPARSSRGRLSTPPGAAPSRIKILKSRSGPGLPTTEKNFCSCLAQLSLKR